MSQEETYVPGMERAQQVSNSLYSRQGSSAPSGTFIPGMQSVVNSSSVSAEDNRPNHSSGEPVVGFLYSISKMGVGEYWPVHLGANTIGRSSKCDVQLKELSVSDNHATLSVKRMRTTNAIIATIRDTGSKNGMYLNDEELDYENHNCKNGDVITVGSNYQLLLILINTSDYGLKISENFVPSESENAEAEMPISAILKPRHIDDGTVDMNGFNSFTAPGETKIM